jgi:hypothetical protein
MHVSRHIHHCNTLFCLLLLLLLLLLLPLSL